MNQSLIRAVLKIGAGYFIAKGYTDESTGEIIIAGLVALISVIWGVLHRSDGKIASPLPAFAILCILCASALNSIAAAPPANSNVLIWSINGSQLAARDTITARPELFHAREWSLDALGTLRTEDLSNLSEAAKGAGVGLNYFPWRAAGFGLEARGEGVDGIFIDHTAFSLIGRYPIDKLRLAPHIKLGTDYDLDSRKFALFAALGAELRLTQRIGFGAELRGNRPITSSAKGENVLALLFLRANW